MVSVNRIRRQQILRAAEGYLELAMPQHALDSLGRLTAEEVNSLSLHLQGEAFRALGRFQDAIAPLAHAAKDSPGDIHIWLSLGWCYKRIGRLDMAIESLEEALEADPNEAIIHYNLACYWSLAGNRRRALSFLTQAFEIDPNYRDRVANEPDFDPLRNDPAFRSLTSVIV
jgi:tetratricopeptide (TPR) repeat protein